MNDAEDLVARYVAVWHESDADARRAAIASLWRADGAHFVKAREARGYAALEQRIIGSYEKNVRDKGNRFRARAGAQRLRDVVTFTWEMVPSNADDTNRIITDYQFIIA
jgi:hypothetical protein